MKNSIRRTLAVFIKQAKDIFNNKMMLLQFVLFPLIAWFLSYFIGEQDGLPDGYFALMFAPMFAGMIPMITIASIIGEEKEKKTLKILAISGVKPFEYLIGVGGFVVLISIIGSVALGVIAGLPPTELALFALVMFLGILASVILGSAIGVLSKNQTNATAMIFPISMLTAFLPMIAIFNDTVKKIAIFLYTVQIKDMIDDLSASNMGYLKFVIIAANMLVFLLIFLLAYKKKKLRE